MEPIDTSWVERQVATFEAERPLYQQLKAHLEATLSAAAGALAPTAIVQARVKGVASFAQKVLRKRDKYRDPVHQLTDLLGARVIFHLKEDVERMSRWIREHFLVDEANSLDQQSRLGASEFGYRSVHFVVQLLPGSAPALPPEVYPLKAELQVRTMAQHAWADIAHDRVYKSPFPVPARWIRELARVAALLEAADGSLGDLVEGVSAYRVRFARFRDEPQMREELRLLQTVRRYDPRGAALAEQIARLQIGLEDWEGVVREVEAFPEPRPAPLLVCHGFALCQLHRRDRGGDGYLRGRRSLEQAVAAAPGSVEAHVRLGEAWAGVDDEKAAASFHRAFELDPGDPEPLCGTLRFKVAEERGLHSATLLRPTLEAALERSRAQAEVGVNLPWSLYRAAELLLLLQRPYQSLEAYAAAVACSPAAFMLEEAQQAVKLLAAARKELPEVEWVRRFLLLARVARFPDAAVLQEVRSLAAPWTPPPRGPVVMIAGGCDPSLEPQLRAYAALLDEAFRGFRGLVVSGGTRQGLSGMVGELTSRRGGELVSIGYLPELMRGDATRDDRYTELRRTPGNGFSPLEPLQAWIDLVAAGVRPAEVKLLGINGGAIAGFEYRLALTLGAAVGILRDSGREASRLQQLAGAEGYAGLAVLPPDPATVHWFLQRDAGSALPVADRELLGRAIHERYRGEQRERLVKTDPVLDDWDRLTPSLRSSNLQQADHVGAKLSAIGMCPVRVEGRTPRVVKLTDAQVETLAELEHARWNVERLQDGWTLGPRDPKRKTSPFLVAWRELPDEIRELDRQAVSAIPEFLASIGMEIRAASGTGASEA